MNETIIAIDDYRGLRNYSSEAGFQITTTEQVITLAICDEAVCCESWGYFLSEDDISKFIGAELYGVQLVDTNRTSRRFRTTWDGDENATSLDEGDVMFVDIETNRGILQFVAYNAHNGYYGHSVRVSSKQLTREVVL